MEIYMKDNLKTINFAEKEYSNIKMGIYMKVILKIIKQMDMDFLKINLET
jgi:hypothetical protein